MPGGGSEGLEPLPRASLWPFGGPVRGGGTGGRDMVKDADEVAG